MAKEILVRIEDGRGTMVRVVSGSVWITEEGDPRDRFMAAGARLAIASDGVTLVSALAPSTVGAGCAADWRRTLTPQEKA
jgi:hypothetical protein